MGSPGSGWTFEKMVCRDPSPSALRVTRLLLMTDLTDPGDGGGPSGGSWWALPVVWREFTKQRSSAPDLDPHSLLISQPMAAWGSCSWPGSL